MLGVMAERLHHRGPDGRGVFIDGPCGLAHARLAILDPERGVQPMRNARETLAITYNGEIYNSPEHRRRLEANGHHFRTTTDTEVILALYEEDADGFLNKLEGIFALALWDMQRRRLVLARDYIGVKPLYVWEGPDAIVFGSEVKAMLADPRVPCRADQRGLMEILTIQNTFPGRTCFEGIRMLEGGEVLVVEAQGARNSRRFWSFERENPTRLNEAEAAEHLGQLVETVVRDQLLSDVPVASYLSGGMDTGMIAALARKNLPALLTFSGGFDLTGVPESMRGVDEREAAERLSGVLGTEHHFREIGPGDLADNFSRILWHLEEPRGSTCYAPWIIAAEAGSRVKVVLSGHGGDELFAGYHARYLLADSYRDRWEDRWFAVANHVLPAATLAECLSPDFATAELTDWPRQAFDRFCSASIGLTPVERAQHFDLLVYMQGLLLIEDKISMAHSLESRVPLLDRRLFQFARSMPNAWKLDQACGKRILRTAMRDVLPAEILARGKMGFGPPDEHYYRTSLRELFKVILLDVGLADRGIVRRDAITLAIQEHDEGRPRSSTLWTLASLELWHRNFIDRADSLRVREEQPPATSTNAAAAEAAPMPIVPLGSPSERRVKLKLLQPGGADGRVRRRTRTKAGVMRLAGRRGRPVLRGGLALAKKVKKIPGRMLQRCRWALQKCRSALRVPIDLVLPPGFKVYARNWWKRGTGKYAIETRAELERHLPTVPPPAEGEDLRIFMGLYATVQPTFLMQLWRRRGVNCRYETLDWNPNFLAPDTFHGAMGRPDIYREHVRFENGAILPETMTFFDDYSASGWRDLLLDRWKSYNVFHFGWFTSFLPDNADVEYLRRSGRAVYFHFRGCFILSQIAEEFASAGGVEAACAHCKKMGWRDEYFRRFHKATSHASRVFVSTPNLCHCSPAFEYVPLTIEHSLVHAPPVEHEEGTVRIVHAVGGPERHGVKGTDHVRRAVDTLRSEGYDVDLSIIHSTTRAQAVEALRKGHVLVEQLNLGSYGNVAVEGMAHGLAVISCVHESVAHLTPGCPIVAADPLTVTDRLREVVSNVQYRRDVGRRCYEFVRSFHSNEAVADHLLRIYKADLGWGEPAGRNTIGTSTPFHGTNGR